MQATGVSAPVYPLAGLPNESMMRITVDQYDAMIDAGIIGEDDAVELLEGFLVLKMSKNSRHSATTQMASQRMTGLVPAGWCVRSQEPIVTADSEPEPDIAIVRGSHIDYSTRHPAATDVAVVVEVADSTLPRDRGVKKRIYAKAGIAVYWIANLVERTIEVRTKPNDGDYGELRIFRAGDVVPLVLDGVTIATLPVAEVLPPDRS